MNIIINAISVMMDALLVLGLLSKIALDAF